jgi:hypothetical protein
VIEAFLSARRIIQRFALSPHIADYGISSAHLWPAYAIRDFRAWHSLS